MIKEPVQTTSFQADVVRSVTRYAWGNSTLKTWFITKNKREFLPEGCKLLFIITGEPTDSDLYLKSTYPQIDDIISDVDGNNIRILDARWI